MIYTSFKHLHVTFAVLSILFFIVRSYWSVVGSPRLHSGFVRVAPHVIDTLLLLAGIYLASVFGWHHTWIAAKIVGLILYIVVGSVAIKRGKTPQTRAIAAVAAVVIFLYIVGVAITKQPMSWLA